MQHKLLWEFPKSLETDRLIVRKYEKGDGEDYFALFERNKNREELKEDVSEAITVKTEEEAEIRIREHEAEWIARRRLVLGVWLKETGECIGQIWIEPDKWEVPSFELGYFIDSGYHRRGYALEASIRSLKFIFEDLHAHKVIILTRDTNEKSWKLAERLGFPKEAHFRESRAKDGKRWGMLYYGMLKDEYRKTIMD
ncbi:N-acetyltransferase [Candidatus Thorarchaeota archaeon]|nr:GNAT family N-acetyltransferase [Candidatus Thorarchaeota archaeon]TFG97094.1 MAG: N-acetyltransferase [Candidatus Thorarchaeota archaeon]